MKKILMILLCCLLAAALCACGNDEPVNTDPTGTTAPSQAPTGDSTLSVEDTVELVKTYIDKPIEDLIAVIGEPDSRDYAPSCLGEGGEDGMLFYDGFIVYTYREGDVETVYDVE